MRVSNTMSGCGLYCKLVTNVYFLFKAQSKSTTVLSELVAPESLSKMHTERSNGQCRRYRLELNGGGLVASAKFALGIRLIHFE